MKIERIKKETPEYYELVEEVAGLRWWNYPKDSGRRIASNALKDRGVDILLIREPLINIPIGVLSFLEIPNSRLIKVVNMGVSKRCRGIGEALIERAREIAGPNRSIWLNSMDSDSDKFYFHIGGSIIGLSVGKNGNKNTFQFSGI